MIYYNFVLKVILDYGYKFNYVFLMILNKVWDKILYKFELEDVNSLC